MGRLPTAADFPSNVTLSVVPPPNGDPPTNVLILLHGLGDTHASFATLARQMNLPETACLSVQAPHSLLDSDHFHWGDDIIFDSATGGLDADAGFDRSTALLQTLVQNGLVEKCGFGTREVIIFGFGQGGMTALNLAVAVHRSTDVSEFAGVISIGGSLPGQAPASLDPRCRTPVLICAGSDRSSVTSASEDKLKRVFEFVEIKRYRKPGDSMPSNRDEMTPIMQFFSRRLKSTKGVPKGSIEVV